MADDDIVQHLTLEGGETVASDYEKMGEAGKKAFDDIYEAAGQANKQLDEISASSKRFGNSITDAASAAASFVSSISKIGGGIGALVTGYVAATKAIIAHNAASGDLTQTTRQLTQQVKANEQGLLDQQLAAVTNKRAFSDLNDQFASGKLSMEDYAKKSVELQRQQKNAADDQAEATRIQRNATEERLKEVAALQKQAQAQAEYNALVAKFGAPLTNALENIGRALNDVFTDFKQTFGPEAAKLVDNIADAIRANAGEIHALFQQMADGLKPFTEDGGKRVQQMVSGIVSALKVAVAFVINVMIPAFEGILKVLDVVATVLNSMFGTQFTGAGIAAVIVIGTVTGAFKALYTAGVAIVKLGELISKTPYGAAFTALIIIIGLVIEHFGGVEAVWKKLGEVWETVTTKMKEVGNSWVEWFKTTWAGQIITTIGKVIDKFNELRKAQDDTTSGQNLKVLGDDGSGGGEIGPAVRAGEVGSLSGDYNFAGGGHVRGWGTETSDSIPAWLSNNEWVMRAAAVRKYGTNFMNMINSLRLDPRMLVGMAGGGLVSSLTPAMAPQRFATGGAVRAHAAGGGRSFNLIIGNELFEDLVAPEKVADRLISFGISKKSRSAGKRQSWVGGAQ